ncbi:hypothetical protein [Intestinibacter bartlettii]|uniref:Uncharacterized protein n=1 Tax=Intestinibacter bartlettii CAG:1329 TaxID=1263063 RepID=R5XNM8_9FIRM|nr:hypothetical protein [Intestinibacter bartlettii]CDA10401.1 unknown [Intestinibacter bartlettii CAG:1329]
MDKKITIEKIKQKKYWIIVLIVLISVTFTPISRSKLAIYRQKEIEYNERKKQHDEFVEMCEGYKADYNNLIEEYDEITQNFNSYKEKYNANKDLNRELNELKSKKEKYLNLIEEYTKQLENL